MGKIHCMKCKGWIPPREMFIVRDDLWTKFGVGKNHLCQNCFEQNIGRALTSLDLTICQANKNNANISHLIKNCVCVDENNDT